MFGIVAVLSLVVSAAWNTAVADVLYWDGNGVAAPNPAGGSGTWSGVDQNWWNGDSNQSYLAGTPPHDAVFGASGGAVNIAAPVSARSLRFDADGYALSGSGVTLAGTDAGSCTVTVTGAADVATIAASLAGGSGIIKVGPGKLVLSASNTFAGLTVREGAVSVNADGQLGDVTGQVTLDGGTLSVTGASSLAAAATRNFTIAAGGGTFDIANTSSTGLTIRGLLSGTGRLKKAGSGTLRLDAVNNMFFGGVDLLAGELRFNNNNDAGPKALRGSRIAFASTSGAAKLSLGGSGDVDTGAGSDLRSGEWVSASPGAGVIVAATTVTDPAIGANGHDLQVFALADATFSGSVANLATSNGGTIGTGGSRNGELSVRGIATQTLSGATSINNTLSVFGRAGLSLSGVAALTGDQVQVNLHGGTLTLDNTANNLGNRIYDSAEVEIRGGGTLTLVGNAAGSSETLGTIQLGDGAVTPPAPRAGAPRPVGASCGQCRGHVAYVRRHSTRQRPGNRRLLGPRRQRRPAGPGHGRQRPAGVADGRAAVVGFGAFPGCGRRRLGNGQRRGFRHLRCGQWRAGRSHGGLRRRRQFRQRPA